MPPTTTTTAASALRDTWRKEIAPAATEEMVIVKNWDDGNEGVEKIGNLLNVRKLATITPTTGGVGVALTPTALTYAASLESRVQIQPQWAYGAVEVAVNVFPRVIDDAELRAGYRTQIAAALAQQIDAQGGQQATSLSNVRGSAADNLTRGLILDGLGLLAKNAKNKWQKGKKPVYLCFHPDQIKHVLAIPEITNANLRGDAQRPNVTGFVWDAWGMMLDESGNIFQSAGITHNLLELRECHLIAYNIEPDILTPQEFELAIRLIGFTEFAVGEVWDEYGIDMQTTIG